MNENALFGAFDDEIATWVIRALLLLGEPFVILAREPAIAGSKHDRHVAYFDIFEDLHFVSFGVFNCDHDWCLVSHIPQPAVVGHQFAHLVVLKHHGLPHFDVIEFDIEILKVGIV